MSYYRVTESIGAGYSYIKVIRIDTPLLAPKEFKLVHRTPLPSTRIKE
jgi:hypothetical protein